MADAADITPDGPVADITGAEASGGGGRFTVKLHDLVDGFPAASLRVSSTL